MVLTPVPKSKVRRLWLPKADELDVHVEPAVAGAASGETLMDVHDEHEVAGAASGET